MLEIKRENVSYLQPYLELRADGVQNQPIFWYDWHEKMSNGAGVALIKTKEGILRLITM